MEFKADTSVIEAARSIAPVIQEHNEEAERERRLSKPVLDALHESGLLSMLTPRSLGGLEVDPVTRALAIEEVARHDSAAAWTLFNPLDWAFYCARLPDEGAEEIFADGPKILIAAQFGKPLKAVPSDGGYLLTGQAPFVSNSYDADWFSMTALVANRESAGDEDEPEMIMAYFPAKEAKVIDTWHVLGMRGTGSNDVSVKDVFVPKRRTFPMVPEFTPGSHFQGPLYRFPMVGMSAACLPAIQVAIARQAIDYVFELAQAKMPVAAGGKLCERASAQIKLAQAEAILRSGRLMLLDTLNDAWEAIVAGETLSLKRKADLLLAMTHAANSATQALDLAYSVAGTSGFREGTPLERYFRDLQVLRQHVLSAETKYATVGQVYLGLPPDFPVLPF